MTITRLIAYAPNGASLGPLPNPMGTQVSYVLNDVGALSLDYHPSAARANLLGQPMEIATEVSYDKGLTWIETRNGRFLYLRDGRDPVKTEDSYAIEAPSYVKRLEKALVGTAGLDDQGQRAYATQTAGAIFLDLFNRAQGRGALAGMAATWTATQDSNGVPWPENQSISYDPGMSLLGVLLGMVEAGWVDFSMQGRSLALVVSETGGEDRTVGAAPVSLRFGRDLTEAPFRRTWEGLADTAVVLGDDGKTVTRINPAALKPWGVQETYVSASGITDDGTLSVLGDAALTYTEGVRAEHTFGLAFTEGSPMPFRDYGPGDWVYAATDGGAPVRMRVRQITLTMDESGQTSGNVVLNDRFLEADILQARRVAKITGGASTQGGNGGTPSGPGPDILAPKAPAGLTANSAAYVTPDGLVKSQITLNWNDVTQNADNTPTADVDHYEVWARIPTEADWRQVAETNVSQWTNSPYDPGKTWEFRIRAVDTSYNVSAASTTASTTTAADLTPPPPPSAPTATTRMGTARITWNGLTSGGQPMTDTPDWRYVTVHVSAVNGFTPDDGNRVGELAGAGYVIAGPLNYSTTYYARLVAVDSSGNKSAASTQVTLVVAPLVDVSNFPDSAMEELFARTGHFLELSADNFAANLIEGSWIKAGAITAELLSISSGAPSQVMNGTFQDLNEAGTAPLEWWTQDLSTSTIANPDTSANTTGWTAGGGTLTASGGGYGAYVATASGGNFTTVAAAATPCSPGEVLKAGIDVKTQGVSAAYSVVILWYNGATFLSSSVASSAGPISGSTYTRLEVTGTAPANTTQARLQLQPTAAIPVGTGWHQKGAWFGGAGGALGVESVGAISGTRSAKVTLGSRYAGAYLRPLRTFPVKDGFTYYCRVAVRLSRTIPLASAPVLILNTGNDDGQIGAWAGGQWVTYQAAGASANAVYVIEGLVTVEAGRKVAAPLIALSPAGSGSAGAVTVVVDDVEWRPATPDSEITTVGAGKIRTGVLQATERIVAGSLAGARAEMNGVGFQAFAPDGRKMFEVQANSGETIVGDSTGVHIRMGAYGNVFNASNIQGMIRYGLGGGWGDAQMAAQTFVQGGFTWAALRMSSPYNAGLAGTWTRASFLDLRNRDDGYAQFFLRAQEANFSANTFIFGSDDGSTVDFRAYNASGFTLANYGMSQRINIYFQGGFNLIRSIDSTGAAIQMRLQGSQVALSASGHEVYLDVQGGGTVPGLGHFERNLKVNYANAGAVTITDWIASAYRPIHASAFTVNSDPRTKAGATPSEGHLEALNALTVYDYDMKGILPRRAPKRPRTAKVKGPDGKKVDQVVIEANRARGVMADEVRAVLPDAVHEDEEGRLSVSLYDLLATTIGAVQELSAKVDALESPTH